MSADQVRQTVEGYLDALTSRGDFARYFSENVSFDVLWSDTVAEGLIGVEQTIRFLHQVAFDARTQVLNLVVGEHGAAVEFSFVGKHIGEFAGIPPTGNAVRVAYSAFYDVEDGRITALRVYLPVDRLISQVRETREYA